MLPPPPLTLSTPAPYEANAGVIAGVAPVGSTGIAVSVGGRRLRLFILRHHRRGFSFGPLGLPARDVTVRVEAYSHGRVVARADVPHVFGLPRVSYVMRPARYTDPAAQKELAKLGSTSQSGVVDAVWVRDLASGRAASYNAGARFPAASTAKLAILMTSLSRESGDPTQSSAWSIELPMIVNSDNVDANAMLGRLGGSTTGGAAVVNAFVAALGLKSTHLYGGYAPRVLSRRYSPAGGTVPPVVDSSQPSFGYEKYTSAHDLGTLLTQLHAASLGFGKAHDLGISQREARVAEWLLLHAVYPGLVRPNTRYPVGHKAGWISEAQHDAAIIFAPRGTMVAVVMTYRSYGVDYDDSLAYGAKVLKIAESHLQSKPPSLRQS